MDQTARAAYIISQSVCAMAEIAGMRSHDEAVIANGAQGVYTEEAYNAVLEKYGVHHNAVIGYLGEG